jgi:hypothetical protein
MMIAMYYSTESEIYTTLASLRHLKAPGPNGFTALFYMKYWDIIKHTILEFFQTQSTSQETEPHVLSFNFKKDGCFFCSTFSPYQSMQYHLQYYLQVACQQVQASSF